MKLVCAAHRGEITPIVHALGAGPISVRGVDFACQGDDAIVIVTGEGLHAATAALASALALLPAVDSVLNVGVAASAVPELGPGSVRQVRTVYGQELDGSMQFRSFNCVPLRDLPATDCVTAATRIFDSNAAAELTHFAPLIDREAWALAAVAKRFGVPFSAIKVVSDLIGKTDCQRIFEQSAVFGDALRVAYLTSCTTDAREVPVDLLPDQFYATKSQRDRFARGKRQLCLRYGLEPSAFLSWLEGRPEFMALSKQQRPRKQQTERLIDLLDELINPYRAEFKKRLDSTIAPLVEAGMKAEFPPDFEISEFSVSLPIKKGSDWQQYKNTLENFDFDRVLALLNGEAGIEV